jgi:hypothetical protein
MPKTSTSFQTTHGGEAAVKQLSHGVTLTGPAALKVIEVERELEAEGITAIIRKNATRNEAVARLFFEAFCAAIEHQDLASADKYAQRFGWLSFRAAQSWLALAKLEHQDGQQTLDDLLGKVVDHGD